LKIQNQGRSKESGIILYILTSTGHLLTSQEPSKTKVIPSPVCPRGETAKDIGCQCSKETTVKGLDGNTRGGCISSPNNHYSEKAHGWCFLENIRNPRNGTENCFEDAKWSVADGRFWSSIACAEEYKKKEDGKITQLIITSDNVILKQISTTTKPTIPTIQKYDANYIDVYNAPSSRIFHTPDLDNECNGSVRLSKNKVVTKVTDIKPSIKVSKVLFEGCGCFKLFSRKGGNGRSFLLTGAGEWMVNMKVGSVKKVSCRSQD